MVELYSNNSALPVAPEGLRDLATPEEGDQRADLVARPRVIHRLADRLGTGTRAEIVRRYQDGTSANTLAKEHGIAPSALLNLLRAEHVVVRTNRVSNAEAEQLKYEYENGATVALLCERHTLSHGAVLRALHRAGATMRSVGRKKLNTQESNDGGSDDAKE